MRLVRLILLSAFTFCFTASAQRTNKSLRGVVSRIAAHNVFESRYVGFAGTPSLQFARAGQLAGLGTVGELLQLSGHHQNAVVRIYAWIAITTISRKELNRHQPEIDLLRLQHLADTTKVFTLSGCIGGESTVAQIIRMYGQP